MTDSLDALRAIVASIEPARTAAKELFSIWHRDQVDAYRRRVPAVPSIAQLEQFALMRSRLEMLGRAIDQLPDELVRPIPGVPWRAIALLPELFSRPDYLIDGRIIWRTLDRSLRDVRRDAQSLLFDVRIGDYP